MTKCEVCGKEVLMPFKCPYCGGYFCAEHRLPEKHNCPGLYAAASPYEKEWKERRRLIRLEEEQRILAKKRVARTEILHLTAGALIVMLAGLSLINFNLHLKWYVLLSFILGFLASFLIHELAHRYSARSHGLSAGFRLDPMGSVLTIITSIPYIPFKIIAPGAVVISGLAPISVIGSIALAGPLSNIILSAIFYIGSYIFLKAIWIGWLHYVLWVLASLNAFIAFFNLLPFGALDGRKIVAWSPARWATVFAVSIILLVLGYMA